MQRKEVIRDILKSSWEAVSDLQDLAPREKSNPGDIVTKADLLVTDLAEKKLAEAFPGEQLLCEESPDSHQMIEEDGWSGWVLDPVDGTNNFSRGIPYWAISLAWIENDKPLVGGVALASGEILLSGQEGLSVSSKTQINEGTRIATSNSSSYQKTKENLARYENLPGAWVDCLGSSVAIMVDVARGALDLYQHNGLKPWDNPAGFLLIREAGGVVCDFSGEDASWKNAEVVCGNKQLVEEFLGKI